MALPTSGPLSLSDIGVELSINSPYSLRSMSAEANFPTPDAVSDFYGYDGGGNLIKVCETPYVLQSGDLVTP